MTDGPVHTTTGNHPASLPAVRVTEPVLLTLFGATGDLAQRKLLPGLYAMDRDGLFSEPLLIVGFARRDHSDESFRAEAEAAVRAHARVPVEAEPLGRFLGRLRYHRGDLEDSEAYRRFRERFADDPAVPPNRLFYLSVKPELFDPVISRLREAGLVSSINDPAWTRVVVEKPFGRDLASARALNRKIRKHLREPQVFRIDHYLGKETVQNILSFRFANSIFEPLFNSQYVDHIQITAAETVGMESGRGAYYDASGAARDMLQNHLLQLLCLVAMEPPSGLNAEAVHNEKVKVLRSLVPPGEEEFARCAVRGQYTAGQGPDGPRPGYLEEDRVAPGSDTETFAAVRFRICNWRWAGTPVYLRTGKRLPRRFTEIAVQFKFPPLDLFQTVACEGDVCDLTHSRPNLLVFRMQPEEGIALTFSAKRPGLQVQVEPVQMDFSYQEAWNKDLPEAYERLLLDILRGDSTLFNRADEVDAAWALIDPVLTGWGEGRAPLEPYAVGTWGPPAARAMFAGHPAAWRNDGGLR